MSGGFLEELGYEVRPGECTFCGDPAPSSGVKQAIRCKRSECVATYSRIWKRHRFPARRPLVPIVERTQQGPRVWELLLDCGHRVVVHGQRQQIEAHDSARCEGCAWRPH